MARACLNGFIVFTLCGLWHGAGSMFLLWGIWHGLFITLERLLPKRGGEPSAFAAALGHIYAMAAVVFGWLLFRSENLSEVWLLLRSMAGTAEVAPAARSLAIDANPVLLCAVAVGAAIATGIPARVCACVSSRLERCAPALLAAARWSFATVAALFSILLLAGGSYNPFIYFRF